MKIIRYIEVPSNSELIIGEGWVYRRHGSEKMSAARDSVGTRVRYSDVTAEVTWFRPLVSPWIGFDEAKPTREDADRNGYIMAWNKHVGAARYVWNFNFETCTHWMPLNEPMPLIERVMIRSNSVIPQENGDIKIGCVTVLKKEMEEIVKQWLEEQKNPPPTPKLHEQI